MNIHRSSIPPRPLAALALAIALPACGATDDAPQHAGTPVGGEEGEHEHHQGEVHLDPEQAAAAGIEAVPATPGTIEQTLELVARVATNEDSVVHVTPRVEGIVQGIHKGLNDEVEAGEPLAEIRSTELGRKIAAVRAAHAMVTAAEETLAQMQQLFDTRLATAERVLDGGIAVARRIYEREEALQEKGIATIRPYLEADRELQNALLDKERQLTTLAADRDARLLELEVGLRQARIEEAAAAEQLLVLGFTERKVDELAAAGRGHGRMVLRAPRDGIVLERYISLQEHVGTDDALFVLHDLSTVWVLASAYEKDLARLLPGQKAYVRLDGLPETRLVGEVSTIDYRVAATTRATSVRIVLPNEPIEGWPVRYPLRPGMFGQVEVVVDVRPGRVVVPEAAIVHEGQDDYVFVREPGDPGAFSRRPVRIRPGAHGVVEIADGVDPGEDVVVAGTFALKSLARGEELGEGHSH